MFISYLYCFGRVWLSSAIVTSRDLMHCLDQDYSDDTDYLYRLQHNSLVIELSKDLPEPVGASEKSSECDYFFLIVRTSSRTSESGSSDERVPSFETRFYWSSRVVSYNSN